MDLKRYWNATWNRRSIWSGFNDHWIQYQPLEKGYAYAVNEPDGWRGGKEVEGIFDQIDALEFLKRYV